MEGITHFQNKKIKGEFVICLSGKLKAEDELEK